MLVHLLAQEHRSMGLAGLVPVGQLPLGKRSVRESRWWFAQPGGTLVLLLQFKGYSSKAKCCSERIPGLLVQNVFLHRVIAM